MSLGLHQQNLDFEIIDTGNTKTIVFLDSSDYYQEPEKPLLEVTLPGATKYFLVNIVPRQVNTFNSNTLGLSIVTGESCLADLPDGVYKFKYKICPYKFIFKVKYRLRTDFLQQKLKQVYIQKSSQTFAPDVLRDIEDRIVQVLIDIETGKAYAEEGNVKKASTFYQMGNNKADKLLKILGLHCHQHQNCNITHNCI